MQIGRNDIRTRNSSRIGRFPPRFHEYARASTQSRCPAAAGPDSNRQIAVASDDAVPHHKGRCRSWRSPFAESLRILPAYHVLKAQTIRCGRRTAFVVNHTKEMYQFADQVMKSGDSLKAMRFTNLLAKVNQLVRICFVSLISLF